MGDNLKENFSQGSGGMHSYNKMHFQAMDLAKIAKEQTEKYYRESSILKFILNGFAFRLKGEVDASAATSLKKLYFEGAKASRMVDSNTYNDGRPKYDLMTRFLVAGFKSLQIRLKLNLGDAHALLESVLMDGNIKFGDMFDLVDCVGKLMEESEFIHWYDNVPWVQEMVNAFQEFAFADIEIGLTHKNFSTSVRLETQGFRELFESAMNGMVNDGNA